MADVVVSMSLMGLAFFAPVLVPIVVAARQKSFPRRFLFVATVFTLNYGLLLWITLIWQPFEAILDLVVPTLQFKNELTDFQTQLVHLLRWYMNTQFLILAVAHFLVGIGLSFYLRRRWPGIVAALELKRD